MDWTSSPCRLQYQRRAVGDEEIYVLILDTGDARVMSVWTREELEQMLRNGLTFLGAIPDGLLLHDPGTSPPATDSGPVQQT